MNQSNPAKNTLPAIAMDIRRPLFILSTMWIGAIAIVLYSQQANAELRCDCAQVIDTCSATVSLDGMRVNIESDSRACSRVDYLIEGQPFAALVVGGSTQLSWPGQPLRDARIVIENCRVCAETDMSAALQTDKSDNEASKKGDSTAEAIVKIMPLYPRDAWTNDIEGDVTIEFNVSAAGIVEQIKVIKSTNPVFITTSIDAISRFRYAPARQDGKEVAAKGVREKFEFRLPNGTNPIVTSAAL
jgi:TonB family protein